MTEVTKVSDLREDIQMFAGHTGLVDIDKLRTLRIAQIGVGSLGSFLAIAMAKMGIENLAVWDFDTVETHNFGNQIFSLGHVGKKKLAIMDAIMRTYGVEIEGFDEKFEDTTVYSADVWICAVDNMEARKAIWEKAKMDFKARLFMDARVGATGLQFISVRPKDFDEIAWFEAEENEFLFEDKDAEPMKCTEKSIIQPVMMASALYTAGLLHLVNETLSDLPRYVDIDFAFDALPRFEFREGAQAGAQE